MLPALLLQGVVVHELRPQQNAELKNQLMMAILNQLDWFVQYRIGLAEYRAGAAPKPVPYPTERVELVEKAVDELIRKIVDDTHTRH